MTMANGLPILEMVKQGKLNNPYLPFYINNFYTNQERIEIMKQYICIAWKSNREDYTFSRVRENESLKDFKKRMNYIFPSSEGWYLAYSEWNSL